MWAPKWELFFLTLLKRRDEWFNFVRINSTLFWGNLYVEQPLFSSNLLNPSYSSISLSLPLSMGPHTQPPNSTLRCPFSKAKPVPQYTSTSTSSIASLYVQYSLHLGYKPIYLHLHCKLLKTDYLEMPYHIYSSNIATDIYNNW